jgi:hypothetical protein
LVLLRISHELYGEKSHNFFGLFSFPDISFIKKQALFMDDRMGLVLLEFKLWSS